MEDQGEKETALHSTFCKLFCAKKFNHFLNFTWGEARYLKLCVKKLTKNRKSPKFFTRNRKISQLLFNSNWHQRCWVGVTIYSQLVHGLSHHSSHIIHTVSSKEPDYILGTGGKGLNKLHISAGQHYLEVERTR